MCRLIPGHGGNPIEIAATQTPAVVLENSCDVVNSVGRLVLADFVIIDGFDTSPPMHSEL
jgi:hypothetical protein